MKKIKTLTLLIIVAALLCLSMTALAATTTTTTYPNGTVVKQTTYSNGTSTGTITTKSGSTASFGVSNTYTITSQGYSISGGGGGSSSSKSSSTPKTTIDLTVTDIIPLSGRQGLNLVSTVSVKNTGAGYASSVPVEFEANGTTQTKYVNVAAGTTVKVSFVWAAPMKDKVSVTATVNKSKTITETNYNNNSLSKDVDLKPGFSRADPEEAPKEAVTIPKTPDGENNRTVTWEEDGKSYSASISLSVSASEGELKSGYGFKVSVSSAVSTNYPDNTVIIEPQQVVMFVPEFGFSSVVNLAKEGGSWVLPVNSISKIGEKRWYVPVWWPDGKEYEAVITAYGAYTPGGELVASDKISIMIDSNMFTDDSTNGMWAR